MNFEQQNSVEILKGEDGVTGLWYPGRIISEIGDNYVVKYESVDGSLTEKVQKAHVRPKPPFKRGKGWVVGDVVQVFDVWSWRVGKIVKVLSKGYFVIRLFGSVQIKEFHESNLRIWQTWHQNKWSFVGKKAKFGDGLEEKGKSSCLRKRDINSGQNKIKKCLPVRTVAKRSNIHRREARLLDKFNDQAITNKCSRLLSTEDSGQCSVASCSSNNTVESRPCRNSNEGFKDLCDNSDAESSFPSTQHMEEKVEIDIHELEYNAYKSTVKALYASGPLSWEQESLLTNLRLYLHISDEEHLSQLRYLLSTQVH